MCVCVLYIQKIKKKDDLVLFDSNRYIRVRPDKVSFFLSYPIYILLLFITYSIEKK